MTLNNKSPISRSLNFVSKNGDTMSGILNMQGNKIELSSQASIQGVNDDLNILSEDDINIRANTNSVGLGTISFQDGIDVFFIMNRTEIKIDTNNIPFKGKEVAGTGRNLLNLNASDIIEFGNSTNTNLFQAITLFNNNISIQGKEVGGTARDLIKMNTSDQIEIGDVNNQINIITDGNLRHNSKRLNPIIAFKTADESVTSSITRQNDDELFVTLEANKTYLFKMSLTARAASTTPDIRWEFTVPTGASGFYWGTASEDPAFGITQITRWNFTDDIGFSLDSTSRAFDINGFIEMGGNSGNLQFKWAQSTSSTSATTIKKGSFIQMLEI